MARDFFSTTQNPSAIGPIILPPTRGDLEEARIRRLIDTAKLFNLQQEPLQNERMYNLQRAQLGETTTYHQAQIADMATGRNLEARGQDVQMRGQDLTADEHKAAIHAAMAQHFTSLLAQRPDVPTEVLVDTASRYGFPEAAGAVLAHKDEMQTAKAKQLVTAYKMAATSGDTKTTGELLNTYRAMPDFNELASKMKMFAPEYAKDFDPTKPGVQTATPANFNDPELAAAQARISEQSAASKAEAERLRLISAKFQARKRAGLEEGKFNPTTPFTIPGYLH